MTDYIPLLIGIIVSPLMVIGYAVLIGAFEIKRNEQPSRHGVEQ